MAQSAHLPRRIIKETQRRSTELKSSPGISAVASEDNLRYIKVVMQGPPQTCYEGGTFKLEMFLPEDYPTAPPKVRFLTKVYHPNINKLGRIYLNILGHEWAPFLQITTALLSIHHILGYPMVEDGCNEIVTLAWKEDEASAMRTAREWTHKYASSC